MDVTAWAIALMEFLGGPGTALVIASEALFPPVPGEVLLPFAGVTAAANDQHVLVPILWTTLGSVLGGLGVYAVAAGSDCPGPPPWPAACRYSRRRTSPARCGSSRGSGSLR